jgi:hypothetical protein
MQNVSVVNAIVLYAIIQNIPVLNITMLNAIELIAIIQNIPFLNVIMLNINMLNGIMLTEKNTDCH